MTEDPPKPKGEPEAPSPSSEPATTAAASGDAGQAPVVVPEPAVAAEPTVPAESVVAAEPVVPAEAVAAVHAAEAAAEAEAVRAAASTPLPSDDGWPLEMADAAAAVQLPVEAPPVPQMPSPAQAAYEAARIVGEMVGDIESAPGAALMAAAAAGAAIEVARARAAAGVATGEFAVSAPAVDTASDPAAAERDRRLRALADDIGANATSSAAAEIAPAPGREPSRVQPAIGREPTRAQPAISREPTRAQPAIGREPSRVQPAIGRDSSRVLPAHGRAQTQPGEAVDDTDDALDPVTIAAAAIARLRERARTDFAELRVQYQRHDLLVIVAALIIIVVAGRVHEAMVTPDTEPFDASGSHGLWFDHSRGWLTSVGGALPPPRIAREIAAPSVRPADILYHAELTSTIDPTARIEVVIDKKPAWSNIVTGLDLDRRTRWGELYTLDDSSVRSIEDHQWLRTAYRFAHALDKGDVPRIDRAVEYATIDREQIYVLTFFGTPGEIERIEDVVAPTLRVATRTGLPLVPQTGHLSARKYPNAVSRAFDSTVMIVVADVIDGRLHARGGGSGIIVGRDGSILTNYHVIHDQNGRLHDAFVIGRFSEQDKAPQLHCAGKPSRGKLQRELDLALLKCDLDLDGRSWNPQASPTPWPTLTLAHTADIKIGQRIWVLGYPDVGGGGLTLAEGDVAGWTGVDGATGRDFLKTDAAIRHGNSGGPVVDDSGRLVGIASAVRTKVNAAGDVIEVVQAGGRVRPIAAATDLLAIAAAGWIPREGHTDVEMQPSAIEAPEPGIQIQSRVLDVVNEAPIPGALVMVLRPGVAAASVDVNRLDDQVLSYGRTNGQGDFLLKQPVPAPGNYTLMVVARGYEPLIGDSGLTLDTNAPSVFDPWGKLLLHAR